jgi:two-component system chemotaxis response regulator CheB
MEKIKVLVVDDSPVIRAMLAHVIDAQDDMRAVGCAPDPLVARDMIKQLDPDVLTLDIEMPRMSGLEFLDKLMRLRPMPVVMVSTLTERGAEATLRALELGAVDCIQKPGACMPGDMAEYTRQITDKIRAAARAKPRIAKMAAGGSHPALRRTDRLPAATAASTASGIDPRTQAVRPSARLAASGKLILIGASTGGTEAVREVLMRMPADSPAILITQHMPAGFTKSFAERLNKSCQLAVKEAEDGEPVVPGHAYVAPGSHHMALRKSAGKYSISLSDGPPVNRHRPSVEVLFKSGAAAAGANAIGIMLTGMGRDGATAMREMRDAGSWNLVQDEASCVVFGMPREAIAAGAADVVVPLTEIAGRVIAHLSRGANRAGRNEDLNPDLSEGKTA